MSAARFLGVQVPVSGGGYFRILPYWLTRAGLKQIERSGRPFTFYLHPWEVDPGQPRIRVGAFSRFRITPISGGARAGCGACWGIFPSPRCVKPCGCSGSSPREARR